MKNWKIVLFFCTLLCLLAVFSVGAAAYEPDGSWSEEYLFPASECNRTVYVNCVDKDTGQTVKSVTYHTKRSENDIISLSLNGYDILTDYFQNGPSIQANTLLLNLLLVICFGYCVIKCFFSNVKRGGILLIQIAVGSLHLFSLPRGYTDGFTGWCRQIIAICFTTFMQTTLLLMGLITMRSHPLLGLGVMLAANEVPRIAQQFGLDTSIRVNMMSAVHTTTTAVNLGRALAKR